MSADLHHRRRSRPRPWATAATSSTTARSRSWSTRSATSTGCSTCSTSTASGSPTSSRPTSTTTTSPAGSPWPGAPARRTSSTRADDVVLRAHPDPRRRDRRGRGPDAGDRAGHARPHLHPPLLRPRPTRRPASAVGVFSGGSLLYGATGRPDLLGPEHTDDLVRHQHASAHRLADAAPRRRRGLPDPRLRLVLLGHPVRGDRLDDRAGEAGQPGPHPGRGDLRRASCSPGSAPGRPTTRTWRRPTPPGPSAARPVARRRVADAAELRRRIEAGEWVVDLRNRTAFAAGHVPGTLNFGLDGAFATYLGWLIAWGTPLTLLGETAEDVAEAQRELVRIGIDRPAAHATGRPRGLDRRRAELASRPPPSPTSPRSGTTATVVVLDVRRTDEYAAARDRAAPSTSRCTSCRDRLDEVPAGEVWVHCAGGYRASVAASMLDAAGRTLGRGRRRLRQRREGRAAPGGARGGVTLAPRRRRRRAHRAQPGRARRRRLDPRRPGARLRARADPGAGDHRLAGRRRRHLAGRRRHRVPRRQRAARPRGRLRRWWRSAARWPAPSVSAAVPEPVLLAAFAVLMLVVGGLMAVRQVRAQPARRQRADRRRHAARPAARRPDHHLQPDLRLPVPARAQGARHRDRRRPAHRVPRRRRRLPRRPRAASSPSRCRWSYAAGTSLVVITMTSAAALAVRAGAGVAPDWRLVLPSPLAAVGGCRRRRPARGRTDTARLSAAFTVLVARRRRLHRRAGPARPRLTHPPIPDHSHEKENHHVSSSHVQDLRQDHLGRLRPARQPGDGRRAPR